MRHKSRPLWSDELINLRQQDSIGMLFREGLKVGQNFKILLQKIIIFRHKLRRLQFLFASRFCLQHLANLTLQCLQSSPLLSNDLNAEVHEDAYNLSTLLGFLLASSFSLWYDRWWTLSWFNNWATGYDKIKITFNISPPKMKNYGAVSLWTLLSSTYFAFQFHHTQTHSLGSRNFI